MEGDEAPLDKGAVEPQSRSDLVETGQLRGLLGREEAVVECGQLVVNCGPFGRIPRSSGITGVGGSAPGG